MAFLFLGEAYLDKRWRSAKKRGNSLKNSDHIRYTECALCNGKIGRESYTKELPGGNEIEVPGYAPVDQMWIEEKMWSSTGDRE